MGVRCTLLAAGAATAQEFRQVTGKATFPDLVQGRELTGFG